MTEQKNQSGSFHARGVGLKVIASMHVVEAIGLVVIIVDLWNSGDPLGSMVEALFWVLLTILLLVIAWGLWNHRTWARLLALTIHWPIFVGVIGLLPLCLYILLLVPARGIAVFHVFALIGLVVFPPILLVSGWTLWYLHRRTLR